MSCDSDTVRSPGSTISISTLKRLPTWYARDTSSTSSVECATAIALTSSMNSGGAVWPVTCFTCSHDRCSQRTMMAAEMTMPPVGSSHHTTGCVPAMAPVMTAPALLHTSFRWSSASASSVPPPAPCCCAAARQMTHSTPLAAMPTPRMVNITASTLSRGRSPCVPRHKSTIENCTTSSEAMIMMVPHASTAKASSLARPTG